MFFTTKRLVSKSTLTTSTSVVWNPDSCVLAMANITPGDKYFMFSEWLNWMVVDAKGAR
jgi:hypothetical protein